MATSTGLYPACLSAAGLLSPPSLSLFMQTEGGSCMGQLSFCALLGSGVLCTFAAAPLYADSEVGLYAALRTAGCVFLSPGNNV